MSPRAPAGYALSLESIMAEEAKKKSDAASGGGDKHAGKDKGGDKKGGGGIGAMLGRTPVMLGGVMVIEAAVLFAGFKFLGGGPAPVIGADFKTEVDSHGNPKSDGHGGPSAGHDARTSVEIPVVEFRAPNKISGRLLLIDVSIFMVVQSEHETQAKETLKAREALIKDRIRTIIAQSDPEKLGGEAEPGLETLRRQVKYQLDEVIGEGMIQEVLVPRCIPIRAD
jgi:flagellar basal body-associated protein FliL